MEAVARSPIPYVQRTRLNLGSGKKYDPLAVNLDLTEDTRPDVVHDLDCRPWPFPDNRFEAIAMHDVLGMRGIQSVGNLNGE